jgi:hypothetical protein
MSEILQRLMDSYGGGTGNLMLYYDMQTFDLINGSGVVKNLSPASTVGNNNAFLDVGKNTGTFTSGNYSGGNLAYSKLTIDSFNNGFLNYDPENADWSASFLFSFTKTHFEDGILFGCLNPQTYENNGITGIYGRGFNFGINDRNQLFYQAIDFDNGPYMIVADKIELAEKNLCSLSIDPYTVRFIHYDLASDKIYEQTKLTTDKTEMILNNEKFYLGGSNFYYKNAGFSGYLDKFAILSGDYSPSILKSIISGFVSTLTYDTGEQDFFTQITGQSETLIQETGTTGYAAMITGYKSLYSTGYFFDRIESTSINSIPINEGYRFITGFELSNGLKYNEEVGYLYKTDEYKTSGNNANATLGLINSIEIVETGGKTVLRYSVNKTGVVPLYQIYPITGFLGPTGVSIDPLSSQVFISGSTGYDLFLNTGLMEEYRHNYIYYLGKRL